MDKALAVVKKLGVEEESFARNKMKGSRRLLWYDISPTDGYSTV